MTAYTLGFVFDPDLTRVMLIRKNRPAWQAGRINGVGGKMEPGETAAAGMMREFREESGLHIAESSWTHVADMHADGWVVHVFAAVYDQDPADVRSLTDEAVAWYPVRALPPDVISNLRWLIPLCVDRLLHHQPQMCLVQY